MFIGTFHLLGLSIMRESLREDFLICSREDQTEVLKPIVGTAKAAQQMAERISRAKNCVEEMDPDIRAVCEAYQAALRHKEMYDFDDLITIPCDILRSGRVADCYRGRFRHIIVDEYQDISPAQYRLLKALVGHDSALCAVGDSDQAIYAFRGADVETFLGFQKDFPQASVVVLNESYRSTSVVTDGAMALIKNNGRRIDKELSALRPGGKPITIISVADERAEAETVVREIEARMGGTSHYRLMNDAGPRDFSECSYSFSDFAVLIRTNAQAKALEEALREWGIPCQIVGKRNGPSRKALIESLKTYLDGPESPTIEGFVQKARAGGGVHEADLLLLETMAPVYRHLPATEALTQVINELSLLTGADFFDPRADAVALMTMHMAKGLEFKVVFVAGVEEGLIPFRPDEEDTDIEEERRLFYVAMTRAKDELFLLHARSRFLYGRRLTGNPSPFLSEIPAEFVHCETIRDKPSKPKRGKQMDLF
jgi:superfamily I DNA/RNA helicase